MSTSNDENLIKCLYCDKMLKNTPKGIGTHVGGKHKEISQAIKAEKAGVFTIACLECNKFVAHAKNGLGAHIKAWHQDMTYADYIVKYEMNGIWPLCKCGCGEKVKYHGGGFAMYAAVSCSSSGENNGMFGKKGKDSPNTGKIRTDEMKEKYSKAAYDRWEHNGERYREYMKSEEYKIAQREAQLKGYEENPEKRKKISERIIEKCDITTKEGRNYREKLKSAQLKSWKNDSQRKINMINSLRNFWDSESDLAKQRRQEASERSLKRLDEGSLKPSNYYKSEWILNPFTGNKEFIHSGWETAFLNYCVKNDIPVTKSHSIRIPYISTDGREHIYVPDFISPDDCPIHLMFEVKGWKSERDKLKEAAAFLWCEENGYEYVVIEEKL